MNLTFQRIEQLLCQHDGYGYIYQELFVTSSYQQTQYVPLNWIFKSFFKTCSPDDDSYEKEKCFCTILITDFMKILVE